jgi:UDP-N-acetylmuramyl pentapeptide phosphotransferase/UDP-N-acetylglucosamine-1-phosphate transferase
MSDDRETRNHDHRLTLFSVSAGMVGVCLTGVGLIGVVKGIRNVESSVDEILTISALFFLLSTALYFFKLYHADQSKRTTIDYAADGMFFFSLALLLVACVVFTIGFE